MIRKAIYPGTFDPMTNGHLDLVTRASLIFDYVVVGVAFRSSKKLLFNLEERVSLAAEATSHLNNVEVLGFTELVAHFAALHDAKILVRGIRTASEFEYELKMANMNRHLMTKLDSVLLMPSAEYSFISSSLVKEIAQYGGDITSFLPDTIKRAMIKKFAPE